MIVQWHITGGIVAIDEWEKQHPYIKHWLKIHHNIVYYIKSYRRQRYDSLDFWLTRIELLCQIGHNKNRTENIWCVWHGSYVKLCLFHFCILEFMIINAFRISISQKDQDSVHASVSRKNNLHKYLYGYFFYATYFSDDTNVSFLSSRCHILWSVSDNRQCLLQQLINIISCYIRYHKANMQDYDYLDIFVLKRVLSFQIYQN